MAAFEQHSVVVVGAGISGLAAAWWLRKSGFDVCVLEHDGAVGGTMKTIHRDGWLIEAGPNSALETTPLLRQLSIDVGIENELIYANEAADKRYILRAGALHALPMKPGLFLGSRLWSLRGKLRLLLEPFIGRSSKEETIAEFVSRRLGSEFLDYAINPFVAGVYAGNPEQLSVQAAFPKLYALEKNYGGLIKGQLLGAKERKKHAEKAKDRSRLFSYTLGMQTLPDGIARALHGSIHLNVNVENIHVISQNGSGSSKRFKITGTKNGRELTVDANAVILAVPSQNAAAIIRTLDAPLATSLKNIYYPPVTEVFLGFARDDISRPLDGFGFLIPAKENRGILGTIWSSVIFPGRTPPGYVALTSFVGGSRQPELASLDDKTLIALVMRELQSIMNVKGVPAFTHVSRWEKAIPQYHLGHLSIVRQMEQFEDRYSGLFLSGNFRGGIAVGDCVINSELTAQRAAQYLANTSTEISA